MAAQGALLAVGPLWRVGCRSYADSRPLVVLAAFLRLGKDVAVSRFALAAVSLVAAIPAGIMAFLAIMAFLRYTENMSTLPMGGLFLAVMGCIAALGVLVALSPIVILVGRRRAQQPAQAVAAGPESAEAGAQTADVVADSELAAADESEELVGEAEAEPTEAYEFDEDIFGDEDNRKS